MDRRASRRRRRSALRRRPQGRCPRSSARGPGPAVAVSEGTPPYDAPMIMLIGRELVLGLQQRAADLGQRGRHPFEQLGRRRDRIGGDEADAAADRAVARGLVAADEPALAGGPACRPECRGTPSMPRRRGDARARAPRDWPRAARRRASTIRAARLRAPSAGMPASAPASAERDHVGPAARDRLRHLLERQRRRSARRVALNTSGALAFVRRRRSSTLSAASGISSAKRLTFCQSIASSRSNASSSVSIGRAAEAHQRRRLAAADLRAAGAHHEAVQPALRGGVEQQRARGHHAAAAAAGERDRDALRGAPRVGRAASRRAARAGCLGPWLARRVSRCIRCATVNRLRGRCIDRRSRRPQAPSRMMIFTQTGIMVL